MMRRTPHLLVLIACAAWGAPVRAAEGTRGVEVVYAAPPEGNRGLEGEVKIYERSHAVVIGIDAYTTLNPLTGAVRDAKAVAKVLEARGFEVTLLLDREATRARIAGLLGDGMPRRVKREDRVLVYFAGHGISGGSAGAPMGYLMPVEGSRDLVAATGISMRELQNWFTAYESKHVMFVSDACYSGLALSTRSVGLSEKLKDYLIQVTSRPVRLAMTAGGKDEVAHEWHGHGLFTYFFLRALDGAADADGDGIMTSDELAAYIRPKVMRTALDQFSAPQTPQIGRDGEGEFVFLTETSVVADSAPDGGTNVGTNVGANVATDAGTDAYGDSDSDAHRPRTQWGNSPAWITAGIGVAAMGGGIAMRESGHETAGSVALGLGAAATLTGLFMLGSSPTTSTTVDTTSAIVPFFTPHAGGIVAQFFY